MILGIPAFTWLTGQFLLAARPGPLIKAMGSKGLQEFHGLMAVVAWIAVFFHRLAAQKTLVNDHTLQARLGTISWLLLALLIFMAVLFMAPGPSKWGPVKAFRLWSSRVIGFNYQKAKLFHSLNLLLVALVVVHMVLAKTSSWSGNPLGLSWLLLWTGFCVGTYTLKRFKEISERRKGSKNTPSPQ